VWRRRRQQSRAAANQWNAAADTAQWVRAIAAAGAATAAFDYITGSCPIPSPPDAAAAAAGPGGSSDLGCPGRTTVGWGRLNRSNTR